MNIAREKLIAPSILAADILNLQRDVAAVVSAGAEILHIDVMDGGFVHAITFGDNVVRALRKSVDIMLDVHLMIENPQEHIEAFASAGADVITVQYEAVADFDKMVAISKEIRGFGAKAGISINPQTTVDEIAGLVEFFDLVLIMTVVAGFGGQKYIDACTAKISEVVKLAKDVPHELAIQVDGGIYAENIHIPLNAGANIFVAGSAVFGANDIGRAFAELEERVK